MRAKIGRQGFTLFEMIIVVAIITTLSAVAFPAIKNSIIRYQLRAESHELMINFKKAQMEASKRNRDIVINFVDAVPGIQNGSYQVFVNVDRDTNVPHTYNSPPDIELIQRQIPKNMRLTSTFTNEQAGYKPNGLPLQNANKNVVLSTQDSARSYTLTVSSAGDVTLQ